MYGIQESDNHKDLYEYLKDWKAQSYIKPSISLTISVGEPNGGPNDSHNFLVDPYRVGNILESQNIQISSSGIVMAPIDDFNHEIENMGPKEVPGMVSMIFPDFGDKVQVIPFSYSEVAALPDCPENLDLSTLNALAGTQIEEASQIKSIILMTNVHEGQRSTRLIQTLGHLTDRNLAIGGCIGTLANNSKDQTFKSLNDMLAAFSDFDNHGINDTYAHTVGLMFAGSAVTAASVLIPTSIKTPSKVEQELKKLKQVDFNYEKSCAFMFACCGRGRNFYKGKANVESDVFRKLFPKTPLMGIFGNGEIGMTYLPSMMPVKDTFSDPGASAKRAKKDLLQPSDFGHSFTTVFLMLSFQ